jgi:tetratricopeptide (TPR) repeat protein
MHRIGKKTWLALVLILIPVLAFGYYHWDRYRRGQSYVREARRGLERRDFKAALDALRQKLELHPDDLDTLLLALQTARRGEQYQEAFRLYEVARQHGEAAPFLEMELRLTRLQKGDLTEAERLLDFCVHNPTSPDAYFVLEALLVGTMRSLPQHPLAAKDVARGEAKRAVDGAMKAAEMWLERASHKEDRVLGLVWRSRLHLLMGQFAPATTDLRGALELNPDHSEARFFLARAIVQVSPAEAASHLEVLLKQDSNNVMVLLLLGMVRRSMGQFTEARAVLDHLVRLEPTNIQFVLERCLVAIDARDERDAEKWVSRARELAPDYPEVHLALSRYMQLAGKESEAAAHYEKFLHLKAVRDEQQKQAMEK